MCARQAGGKEPEDLPPKTARCWCHSKRLVRLVESPEAGGMADQLPDLGDEVQDAEEMEGSADKP
jgi:hypothetical protein